MDKLLEILPILDKIIPIISPILVGGVIGYFTNWLAIKMLFRPRKAKYIFGKKLPFTPGLIPSQKPRIAKSLSQVISDNLISGSIIKEKLLSKDALDKARSGLKESVIKFCSTDESVSEMAVKHISPEVTDNFYIKFRGFISDYALKKAQSIKTDEVISKIIEENSSIPKLFLPIIAGGLKNPVDKFINNDLKELVEDILDKQKKVVLETNIKEYFTGKEDSLERLTDFVIKIYSEIIEKNIETIISKVDFKEIIFERVMAMDEVQFEKLLLDVINKELKAIVWLGAVLGALIGIINIFI